MTQLTGLDVSAQNNVRLPGVPVRLFVLSDGFESYQVLIPVYYFLWTVATAVLLSKAFNQPEYCVFGSTGSCQGRNICLGCIALSR